MTSIMNVVASLNVKSFNRSEMMDLTQISLRTSRDQVERIKTYAKASNLSVNAFLVNLIENSLNNIANDGTQSELTRLVAEIGRAHV